MSEQKMKDHIYPAGFIVLALLVAYVYTHDTILIPFLSGALAGFFAIANTRKQSQVDVDGDRTNINVSEK